MKQYGFICHTLEDIFNNHYKLAVKCFLVISFRSAVAFCCQTELAILTLLATRFTLIDTFRRD